MEDVFALEEDLFGVLVGKVTGADVRGFVTFLLGLRMCVCVGYSAFL